MDLIDREAMMNYIRSKKINIGKLAHDVIMKQPSIQPQEPKTGRWKRIGHDIYECSICSQNVMTSDICAYRHCHCCGTKMKVGVELEQEPILDKIKAEIEQNAYPIVHGVNNHEKGMTLYGILQVIDKYRGD